MEMHELQARKVRGKASHRAGKGGGAERGDANLLTLQSPGGAAELLRRGERVGGASNRWGGRWHLTVPVHRDGAEKGVWEHLLKDGGNDVVLLRLGIGRPLGPLDRLVDLSHAALCEPGAAHPRGEVVHFIEVRLGRGR